MAGATTQSWDELRREARMVENEVDVKLGNLSKMSGSLNEASTQRGGSPDLELGDEGSPLMAGTVTKTLMLEISELLSKLETTNNLMQLNRGSSVTVAHTVQRHRDTLKEYQEDFAKSKALVDAALERQDLFSGARDSPGSSETNHLLRERNAIQQTQEIAGQALESAIASREDLIHQRSILSNITTKLRSVGRHFPQINTVIGAVQRRKSRDQMIIAGVIALCIFTVIYYLFLGD